MKRLTFCVLCLLIAWLLAACALTGSVGISLSPLPTLTPSPTPGPEMTLDYSISLTRGILVGAVLLVFIIVGGSFSVIAIRNRKK